MENGESARALKEFYRKIVEESHASLFFAVNDEVATQLSEQLVERGRKTKIVSVDGSPEAIQQIRDGGPIIATVAQSPREIVQIGRASCRESGEGEVGA